MKGIRNRINSVLRRGSSSDSSLSSPLLSSREPLAALPHLATQSLRAPSATTTRRHEPSNSREDTMQEDVETDSQSFQMLPDSQPRTGATVLQELDQTESPIDSGSGFYENVLSTQEQMFSQTFKPSPGPPPPTRLASSDDSGVIHGQFQDSTNHLSKAPTQDIYDDLLIGLERASSPIQDPRFRRRGTSGNYYSDRLSQYKSALFEGPSFSEGATQNFSPRADCMEENTGLIETYPSEPISPALSDEDTADFPRSGISQQVNRILDGSAWQQDNSTLSTSNWNEYRLPDGSLYWVHRPTGAVTDVDLRNDKDRSLVNAYLQYKSPSSSLNNNVEVWLRNAEPGPTSLPRRDVVDHEARTISAISYSSVRNTSAPDDPLDDEILYWKYVAAHPCHMKLPIKAEEEAFQTLMWSYADQVLTTKKESTLPFSQEEARELIDLLRALSLGPAPGSELKARILANVHLRSLQWRQNLQEIESVTSESLQPEPVVPHLVPVQQLAMILVFIGVSYFLLVSALALYRSHPIVVSFGILVGIFLVVKADLFGFHPKISRMVSRFPKPSGLSGFWKYGE